MNRKHTAVKLARSLALVVFTIGCMAFGLFQSPDVVSAADIHEHEYATSDQKCWCGAYDLWVGSTQVTVDNNNDILGNGKVKFLPDSNTLKLDDVTIDTYARHSIPFHFKNEYYDMMTELPMDSILYAGGFNPLRIKISGHVVLAVPQVENLFGFLSTAHWVVLEIEDDATLEIQLGSDDTGMALLNGVYIVDTSSKLDIFGGTNSSLIINAADGIYTGTLSLDQLNTKITSWGDGNGIVAFEDGVTISGDRTDLLIGVSSNDAYPIFGRNIVYDGLMVAASSYKRATLDNFTFPGTLTPLFEFDLGEMGGVDPVFGHSFNYIANDGEFEERAYSIWICKDTHKHNFNQRVEDDAYLAVPATCTHSYADYYYSCVCGAAGDKTFTEYENAFDNHSSDAFYYEPSIYVNNEHSKFHDCCGAYADETSPHVFGDDETCDVCNATYLDHEHTFASYNAAYDRHWAVCLYCDYTDMSTNYGQHTFENNETVCDVCEYDITTMHIHKYTKFDNATADGHTQHCGCEHSAVVAHTWGDDNVCDFCQYEKAALPGDGPITDPQPSGGLPVGLIIGIVAAVLAVGVVVVIILRKKN